MKRAVFGSKTAVASAAALLICPSVMHACPMCMGAADGNTGEALNNAIFLLLGCIGAMLAGISAVAYSIYRRARRVAATTGAFAGPNPLDNELS